MTLQKLPRRKIRTFKQKIALATTIAAAVALFAVFAAPPIVRAAGQLYARLFGDVIADIETEQAKPDEQKFEEMLAIYEESDGQWHKLEGASAQFGDVQVSVRSVGIGPQRQSDLAAGWQSGDADKLTGKGDLSLELAYDKLPPFDPNYVDFLVSVDGKDMTQTMTENLREYRERKLQTLTQDDWDDDMRVTNSWMQGDTPCTYLNFTVDDWKWIEAKQLVLEATIDGQRLEIPFEFSPEKAHEQAVADAELSVKLGEENYEHEKDELEQMNANAVPVGLSGSAFGHDYEISEMSFANGKLFFATAFGGIEEENKKFIGMDYRLSVVSVDGMGVALGGSDNDTFKDGVYTAVYGYPLGRDPRNLPEESLIAVRLEVEKYENTKDLAFRYNWNAKRVTLPKDDAEMQAWVDEARKLEAEHEAKFGRPVGYDLTPLNLTQQADGVSFTITGARYVTYTKRIEFDVKIEGDVRGSKYIWGSGREVTINGLTAYDAGASLDEHNVYTAFDVAPPLDISEFGNGEEVVFSYFLYDKNGELDRTNYPPAAETLRFAFTIDKNTLPALRLDEYGFVIEKPSSLRVGD